LATDYRGRIKEATDEAKGLKKLIKKPDLAPSKKEELEAKLALAEFKARFFKKRLEFTGHPRSVEGSSSNCEGTAAGCMCSTRTVAEYWGNPPNAIARCDCSATCSGGSCSGVWSKRKWVNYTPAAKASLRESTQRIHSVKLEEKVASSAKVICECWCSCKTGTPAADAQEPAANRTQPPPVNPNPGRTPKRPSTPVEPATPGGVTNPGGTQTPLKTKQPSNICCQWNIEGSNACAMITKAECLKYKENPLVKDLKVCAGATCVAGSCKVKVVSAAGALYGSGSPDETAHLVPLTIEPTTPITVVETEEEFSVPVDLHATFTIDPAPADATTVVDIHEENSGEDLDPPMEGIPTEICDCLRLLAWYRGEFGRYNPNEQWEIREDDPQEFCDVCGGTPMCVVCMEYDLAMWVDYRMVTPEQALCLLNVNEYLQSISGEDEYYEAAAIYWIAHWDGFNLRNKP